MKYYVYRHNYYGFYDWVGDLNKIRNEINSYQNTNKEMKEYYAEKNSQALQCYKDYLVFKSTLCKEEVDFIDVLRKHKTPTQKVDFNSLYKRWEDIIIGSGHVSVLDIAPEEIGTAIKEAREFSCRTRKQVAEIKNFRNLPEKDRKDLIEAYKNTHFGNITLVHAPSARYFISLCEISGLVEHISVLPRNLTKELIALKLKDDQKDYIRNTLLPKYDGVVPYNFGEDLLLWIEYFGDPDILSTPYDADIENKSGTDVFCVVKCGGRTIFAEVLNKDDVVTIPAFIGKTYNIELYSLLSGSELGYYVFAPTSPGDYYQIKSAKETPPPEPTFLDLISLTNEHINTGRFPRNFSLKLGVIKAMTGEDYNNTMMRGAYLEYNFFRLLQILKNEGVIDDVLWNGSIGKYRLPRPAPGGKTGIPDLIIEIDGELFVLEVTTIKAKDAQFKAEGASVPDHIRLFAETTSKKVYGVYSAPIMHVRVNNAMQSTLAGYGLTIKCLTINDLLTLLCTKDRKKISSGLK